ncbi:MAG: trimethylamine methyltransferase family protein, partial [Thermoplasmata archaeon]|nr:trimethylamine methyltransferase family protein [Thermoplasmata archaeon]
MARARFEFLSKGEIEEIHAVSLRILEEVGVLIHSPEVARLLADRGAGTSKDGKRVLISEDLVKEALRSSPKSILLASRGFTLVEIGIVTAVYPAVWGIGQLFTGAMADRFCKKNLLFVGMFLEAIALFGLIWA